MPERAAFPARTLVIVALVVLLVAAGLLVFCAAELEKSVIRRTRIASRLSHA